MVRKKGFANSLVEKTLVNRSTGAGRKQAYTKTLTIPARYLDSWTKDKTFPTDAVKLIPLGGINARLGFIVVPHASPLLVIKPQLEVEVKYFEARLNELYKTTLNQILDQLLDYKDKPSIMTKTVFNNLTKYLQDVGYYNGVKNYFPPATYDLLDAQKKPSKKKKP